MIDARGLPTAECPSCGGVFFKIEVRFDPIDYEIGMYKLDGECSNCGTLVTVPTPFEHPKNMEL